MKECFSDDFKLYQLPKRSGCFIIKNKFAAMLSNATCEANLSWPKLCRENVNLLRFENFVPNASRIYDDSQEILRYADNGTEHIS